MKKIYIITLLTSATLFSQTELSKTLGEFSELKVYDLINVELFKGAEDKIIISGKNTKDVSVVQRNNILKIKMKINKKFKGAETKVKIYYTSLDVIDANQGAIVSVKEPIEKYELTLKAQEGARIIASAKTKRLTVRSVTGGIVTTFGSTAKQDIDLRTGGLFFGEQMEAENTSLKIRAGGEANVRTLNILEVNIFSGGDVFIYGSPKQLKQQKVFGGRIMFKD
ncbi:MAG: chaperonin [Flavobacteriaceae bacterium]|nr:chaperonin [Flavobacteriaceae bacterium]|tara:strand:+ start:16782 stop:17453 length:672 start_codon:yes stop_codon:yes gene_type:complete